MNRGYVYFSKTLFVFSLLSCSFVSSSSALSGADARTTHVARKIVDAWMEERRVDSKKLHGKYIDAYERTVRSVANALSSLEYDMRDYGVQKVTSTPVYSHRCEKCLKSFTNNDRVGALSCGHLVHPNCADYLVYCPVCFSHDVHLAKIYNSKYQVPGCTETHGYSPSKPTTSYSSTSQAKYSPNCSSCGREFFGEERVGVLSCCGLVGHPECLRSLLEKTRKECPFCEKKNVFVSKIYDSKEKVPGYYSSPSAPSAPSSYSYSYQKESSTPPAPSSYSSSSSASAVGQTCSICFEEVQSGESSRVLSCGHGFHSDCINPWLERNRTCPNCRANV
jgi:hypothetical protein